MTQHPSEPVVTSSDGLWRGDWQDGYTVIIKEVDTSRTGYCRTVLDVEYHGAYVTTQGVDLLNPRSCEDLAVKLGARNGVPPVIWDSRLGNLYRNLREAQASADPTGRAQAVLIQGDAIQEEQITYQWEPYIPNKMTTILDGDPGVGKTGLACLIAASVTRGYPMPDQRGKPGPTPGSPGNVLMVAMEDNLGAVIVPRLKQCGADVSRITFVNECVDARGDPRLFTLADIPLLGEYMDHVRPRLVYIDAIQAVLGAKNDINRANVVTALLAPLKKLAEQYDCAILCSRHPAKPGQHVAKVIYRGMGSQAFVGTVRSGLFVETHPADDTKSLLVHYKSNTGALGRTHIFSKAKGLFEWCGVTRITHTMLAGDGGPGPLPTERLKACLWLEQRLTPGVPTPASEIYHEADEAHDWSEKVVRKASEYLKVTKTQILGDYLWSLAPLKEEEKRSGVSGVSGFSGISGSSGVSGVDWSILKETSLKSDTLSQERQSAQDTQDTQDVQDTPDIPVVLPPSVAERVNTWPHENLSPLGDDAAEPCIHEHVNDLNVCNDCGEVLDGEGA